MLLARDLHQRRFNPHPPLLAGETVRAGPCGLPGAVSIHTRHYWRVKPGQVVALESDWVFQSTPAITGG